MVHEKLQIKQQSSFSPIIEHECTSKYYSVENGGGMDNLIASTLSFS